MRHPKANEQNDVSVGTVSHNGEDSAAQNRTATAVLGQDRCETQPERH